MNSYTEFEQCNIKLSEDPLAVHEIKAEPIDIKSEIKTENEECDDIEHHIYPVAELFSFPSIEIKSEVLQPTIQSNYRQLVNHRNCRLYVTADVNSSLQSVEGTQESLDKLLEDCENKSQCKEKNTEQGDCGENNGENFQLERITELVNDHAEEMVNTCSVCNNSLLQCDNLSVCTEITDTEIKCNISNKSSSIKNLYTFSGNKPVTCNICGHKNNPSRHKRFRTNEKLFMCDICSKSFFDQSTLTRHVRTHTNEKPFSCKICRTSFSQKFNFSQHVSTHTNKKPFTCNVCSKSFSQKSHLTRHLFIHTNERPFACNFCSKSFSQKSYLAYHIRTHTNEKPFACNLCTRSFFQKSDLTQHLRTHTNERRFSCNICGKSFSKKSNLSVHTRTHTVDKPFTCETCNKSFYNKHDLTRHIRIHTDEKPFSCTYCNKSFSVLSNLGRHIRIHTNEKPFTCDICSKSFSMRSSLIHHIHTHK